MNDKTKYLEYINNSKEWKIKRESIILLKGYKCERCGSVDKIHIHHGTYKRLFDESMKDLFVLCSKCHNEYHKNTNYISIKSTKAFIENKYFEDKYSKYQNVEYVKNDKNYFFDELDRCKDCLCKLTKHKTKKHKDKQKSIVSPYYFKCDKCNKIFFPKYRKNKQSVKNHKKVKLTKEQKKNAFDVYRETKIQKHEEMFEIWKNNKNKTTKN